MLMLEKDWRNGSSLPSFRDGKIENQSEKFYCAGRDVRQRNRTLIEVF